MITASNSVIARVPLHPRLTLSQKRSRPTPNGDTTPILALDAGTAALCITVRGKKATDAAVEFARTLAREAQRFADEMERMDAAQLADDDTAAGSDAA